MEKLHFIISQINNNGLINLKKNELINKEV